MYVRGHLKFSAFMQVYKEYVGGEGNIVHALKNVDIGKYGDHVTSTFSEYALWYGEGGKRKSTLCKKLKVVNNP